MDLRETWRARAGTWIRWFRSPDLDDDFWQLRLAQFLDLLPPGRLTLDVGCEEIREPVKTDGGRVTMPFLDLLARQPSA